ncbi:MAG: hypothetical protein ACE5DN_00265 [Flavobacteriales bacterium]
MKTTRQILGIAITLILCFFQLNSNASNKGVTTTKGVVFQLHIGPLSAPISGELYDKYNITMEYENDDGLWYEIGDFRKFKDATVAENSLKFYGIDKLEVRAYFNGRKVSISDALTLLDNQNKFDEQYIMSESIPVSDLDKMINARLRGARLYYAVKVSVYTYKDVDKLMDLLTDMDIKRDVEKGTEYNIGWFDKLEDARKTRKSFIDAGLVNVFIAAYVDNERISFFEAEELERFKSDSFAQELGAE